MTPSTATAATVRMPSSVKLAWIAGIAVVSALPGFLVGQLVDERQGREGGSRAEIVQAWGPDQHVEVPTLVLPVTHRDGTTAYLRLAPRTLDVKADMTPQSRHRGIFTTTVYEAAIAMTGTFDLPPGFRDGGGDGAKAGAPLLVVGLSGLQGVRDEDHATLGGADAAWQTCADALTDDVACRGMATLVADVDLARTTSTSTTGDSVPFEVKLHLRGTGSLRLATTAKHTSATIAGAWASPGFVGADLPAATLVKDGAFEAKWTVDRMGRPSYVTFATVTDTVASQAAVGVDLVEATPVYRTIARVTKYGLLIVVLAFSTYVLFELLSGVRVALLQYGLLGASLSLFTLLLLSVSELAGYTAGYLLSAAMVTAQASLYTLSVTRRLRQAGIFAAMLSTVFGFLYVLLGLESYALVVGSVAIFVVLSILMGVTQKVQSADDARAMPLAHAADAGPGAGG